MWFKCVFSVHEVKKRFKLYSLYNPNFIQYVYKMFAYNMYAKYPKIYHIITNDYSWHVEFVDFLIVIKILIFQDLQLS